jgi:hypothetical protein
VLAASAQVAKALDLVNYQDSAVVSREVVWRNRADSGSPGCQGQGSSVSGK